MKCLVLAGGAGNRMWPISRKNYPKQFVFLDGRHSMFQETIIRNMSYCDEFIIITSEIYRNIVNGQMSVFPGLKYRCIYEEEVKRTLPALLFACMCVGPDEELLVASTDSIIDSGNYMDMILSAKRSMIKGRLVCVGARTNHPTLGVGYLKVVDEQVDFIYPNDNDELLALQADKGLFYDTGILLGHAGVFIDEIKKHCSDLYNVCISLYNKLQESKKVTGREIILSAELVKDIPSISIGYGLTSKSDRMALVIGDFTCDRIISLNALDSLAEFADDTMNIVHSCDNVTITNLSGRKVVAANGLKDLLIVNTEDAVYISDKNKSDQIKELLDSNSQNSYLKNAIEERPQYYTTWGLKEVLHTDKDYWVRRITLYPGQELKKHFHEQRAENWNVVSGKASVFLDGNYFELLSGDSIHVAPGRVHQLANNGSDNLVVVETAIGQISTEYEDYKIGEKHIADGGDDIIAMTPYCKEIIWGGMKLHDIYGKTAIGDNIAESWEISAHPSGQSIVANGSYRGLTFGEYLRRAGSNTLGWKGMYYDRFPLLIKFIDALNDLSVQVHPDDNYALVNEHQYGKNEMWYVMEAEPGACLYCGFNSELDTDEIKARIKNNTLSEVMNRIEVHPGESYFIPAGTVHAIGKGVLVCEVQQNSDVTYRLYDYGRVEKNGSQRELHIDKGIAVLNSGKWLQNKPKISINGGEVLCNCKYFTVMRYSCTDSMTIWGDMNSFTALVVTKGKGTIEVNETRLPFKAGDSFFVPAKPCAIKVSGEVEVITARV